MTNKIIYHYDPYLAHIQQPLIANGASTFKEINEFAIYVLCLIVKIRSYLIFLQTDIKTYTNAWSINWGGVLYVPHGTIAIRQVRISIYVADM